MLPGVAARPGRLARPGGPRSPAAVGLRPGRSGAGTCRSPT